MARDLQEGASLSCLPGGAFAGTFTPSLAGSTGPCGPRSCMVTGGTGSTHSIASRRELEAIKQLVTD